MARATAAEVVKLFGGVYPGGLSTAVITASCDMADYILDGYVRKNYEASLSTTDTSVIHLANQIVTRLAMRMLWYQAGGALSGAPEPEILTEELKFIIDALMADTSSDDHAMTLDAIDTDD